MYLVGEKKDKTFVLSEGNKRSTTNNQDDKTKTKTSVENAFIIP